MLNTGIQTPLQLLQPPANSAIKAPAIDEAISVSQADTSLNTSPTANKTERPPVVLPWRAAVEALLVEPLPAKPTVYDGTSSAFKDSLAVSEYASADHTAKYASILQQVTESWKARLQKALGPAEAVNMS